MNSAIKKRLQIAFTDEAWSLVDQLTQEASQGFKVGHITYSDVVNELILNAKIDLKTLQAKKTDVKRSLRHLATLEEMDLDSAIKALSDLKAKVGRKSNKNVSTSEGA